MNEGLESAAARSNAGVSAAGMSARLLPAGLLAAAALSCLAACTGAARPMPAGAAAEDGFTARVEALALLQTLNAELLSHDSATQTLERWCGDHRLAAPPVIVAERVAGTDRPPTAEQRAELKVGPEEQVRHRHVRLRCGAVVLSEADNWYVPSRLTLEMNELLDSTDTPFGKAVQALHFQRRTLGATLLWSPLAQGWEMHPATGYGATRERAPGNRAPLQIPGKVLEHRAVLVLPDGMPISEVVETYTGSVLAFPMPRRLP